MAKIQVGGAGGALANNFIRSLRESKRGDYIIGTTCVPTDLFLADAEEKYVVPHAVMANFDEKNFESAPGFFAPSKLLRGQGDLLNTGARNETGNNLISIFSRKQIQAL